MWIALVTAMIAVAAPAPGEEAETLGRALAEQGTLAALLPLMKASQIDELLAENSALDAGGKTMLSRDRRTDLRGGSRETDWRDRACLRASAERR